MKITLKTGVFLAHKRFFGAEMLDSNGGGIEKFDFTQPFENKGIFRVKWHLFKCRRRCCLVPRTGLEPVHLAASAPEADASTNFATWAQNVFFFLKKRTL